MRRKPLRHAVASTALALGLAGAVGATAPTAHADVTLGPEATDSATVGDTTDLPTDLPTDLTGATDATDGSTDGPTDEPTDGFTDGCQPVPPGDTSLPTDAVSDGGPDVTDTPTDGATEPTDATVPSDVTDPTDVATDDPTDLPTDEPTDDPTDVATDDPTDLPTDEPTDEPTSPTMWVCPEAAGGLGPTTTMTTDSPQPGQVGAAHGGQTHTVQIPTRITSGDAGSPEHGARAPLLAASALLALLGVFALRRRTSD